VCRPGGWGVPSREVGCAEVADRPSRRETYGVSETPTIFVLFGATGDLAKRMVLPAFYTLAQKRLLPADWRLVGNGRGDVAHEDFRKHVHDVLEEFGPGSDGDGWDDGAWEEFEKRLLFAGGGFNSDDPGSLLDVIERARGEVAAEAGAVQFVHYIATPPVAFE
jgi:glucose-6-phosphate 1-dehydrogenase